MKRYFLSLICLGFLLSAFLQPAWAAVVIRSDGSLVVERGAVLGEGSGDEKKDEDKSGSSGSGSGSSGSSGSSGEDDMRNAVRTKTEPGKTEIRFNEEERIRVREKEGERRVDVVSGGVKVRMETKDGKLRIKAEREDGGEVDLGQDDVLKIEERLDKNSVKVATGSGDSFVFSRGGFGAKTNFPLSVDLATNALTVETPAGTKTVAVLPDQAVANMLATNVIDRLGATALREAAASGALTNVAGVVNLGLRNNVPVYEVAGLSEQKFLGFLPVVIPTTAVVSAQTGELVAREQTLLNRLLDALSL